VTVEPKILPTVSSSIFGGIGQCAPHGATLLHNESKNYVVVDHVQQSMELHWGLQRSLYGNEPLLLAIET
jgi:hypothetical protein